jgi:hypothetical protein
VNGFLKLSVAAAALAASLGGAAAQTQGDWVLARYKGGPYWYPGIIQGVTGDRVTVAYDDGDRETLSLRSVAPTIGPSAAASSATSRARASGTRA